MFPFKTALNASTLFPFALDVKQQVQVAAAAGYEGIELWVQDIEAFLSRGGTLGELRLHADDCEIAIVNAITFFKWADADETIREAGFAQAVREMQLLAELGCPAVAAPPYGDVAAVTLEAMAGHFRRLSELGRSMGVEPYLEFWGKAPKLSRLSEAMFIALECGSSDVKLLLDPFHMYTGGSAIQSLAYLKGANIGIVHVNDYPALPARGDITDSDRVFPGEGIAPTHEFAGLLDRGGYHSFLSLELFSSGYGEGSALDIAQRGLESIKQAYSIEG